MSRHGLLPLAHRTVSHCGPGHEIPFGAGHIRRYLQWLRTRVADHEAQGGDWREVVDGIRPFNQEIWGNPVGTGPAATSSATRAPWWDVHRHRMAPEIEVRITPPRCRSGRLIVMPAKLCDIEPTPPALASLSAPRRRAASRPCKSTRLSIVAASSRFRIGRQIPPMHDLLVPGRARLDPLHIGIDVAADGALVDAVGATPPQRLFAVGPLARAALWEITQFRKSAAQCARPWPVPASPAGATSRRAGAPHLHLNHPNCPGAARNFAAAHRDNFGHDRYRDLVRRDGAEIEARRRFELGELFGADAALG